MDAPLQVLPVRPRRPGSPALLAPRGGRTLGPLLAGVELLVALASLAGGLGLVARPSGAALALPPERLAGSPFGSYLGPGLLLAGVVGGLALAGAWGTAWRRPWGPVAAAFSGGALAVWIGVQMALMGYLTPLQPVCLLVGLGVLALAVATATRAPWAGRDAAFYVRWTVANGWSEGLGLGGTALVAAAVVGLAPAAPSALPTLLGAAAVVAAGAGLEGALVGYAQARVLGRRLPGLSRRDWVVATALGAGVAWTLGMVPSVAAALAGADAPPPDTSAAAAFFDGPLQYAAAAGMGLVLGPVLGWPQRCVLRRHVHRSGRWVAANAAAWAVGMPLVFLGAGGAFASPDPVRRALILAGTVVLAGLAVGAVHGAMLVGLLRRLRQALPAASGEAVRP